MTRGRITPQNVEDRTNKGILKWPYFREEGVFETLEFTHVYIHLCMCMKIFTTILLIIFHVETCGVASRAVSRVSENSSKRYTLISGILQK